MADKDTDLKIDNVSYEDDPTRFCQMIYEESVGRNEDLRDINEENRLFYEGIDRDLQTRGKSTRVKRSSLFVHEMTPAIDTRIGDVISKLEETGDNPLKVKANFPNLTTEQKDQIIFIEERLNLDLRQSRYLTDVFREQITAAEIYRSPSAVKVGWGRGHRMVAEPIIPSEEEIRDAVLSGKQVPTPQVRFVKKKIDGPFVDWLPPDQFLYEPNRSDFENSRYAVHPFWMTWDELMAEAQEQDWDVPKIKKLKDEIQNEHSASDTSFKGTMQESIEAEKKTPFRKGFKDNRVLVTENYITTFDPLGREKVMLAVMVGNKVLVRNKPSVYMAFKFPFVPIVANRMPGTIEGLSSVDRTKSMQRLNNEIYNSWIDAVTYRIFPPFKVGMGFSMDKQPSYGPGEIWRCSEPDDFKPVLENIGDLPDLATLSVAVGNKIRQMLAGAVDLNQGFNSNQYEKATSTALRAQGSAKRSTTTYKNYGEAIVHVAEKFLGLNQQYAEDGYNFAMDISLDVPVLTSVTDPEQAKQEAVFIHQMLQAEPMYNMGKIGMGKRRAIIERVLRLTMGSLANEYSISTEELDMILQTQQMAAEAQLEKQGIAEQMQMQQAQMQPAAGGQ